MTGDNDQTMPVWLHDKNRPCFQRGQTNPFVIGYSQSIGDLSYVQIWHNNGGKMHSQFSERFIQLERSPVR